MCVWVWVCVCVCVGVCPLKSSVHPVSTKLAKSLLLGSTEVFLRQCCIRDCSAPVIIVGCGAHDCGRGGMCVEHGHGCLVQYSSRVIGHVPVL